VDVLANTLTVAQQQDGNELPHALESLRQIEVTNEKLETPSATMSLEQTTSGSLVLPSTSPARRALDFGPRDPSKSHAEQKSIKKKTSTHFHGQVEDISVEELRAQFLLSRKEQTRDCEVEIKDANAGAMSAAVDEKTDVQSGSKNPDSSIAASSTNADGSEDHKSSGRAGTTSASRESVASASSAGGNSNGECTAGEGTMTCVRDLMRCSNSSAPSRRSSMGFDEPTYTMQDVQLEVLGMFADSPKGDAPPLVELFSTSSADMVSQLGACPEPVPSFEVFQDDAMSSAAAVQEEPTRTSRASSRKDSDTFDFAAANDAFDNRMGEPAALQSNGHVVRELRQNAGGLTVFTDTEFDLP